MKQAYMKQASFDYIPTIRMPASYHTLFGHVKTGLFEVGAELCSSATWIPTSFNICNLFVSFFFKLPPSLYFYFCHIELPLQLPQYQHLTSQSHPKLWRCTLRGGDFSFFFFKACPLLAILYHCFWDTKLFENTLLLYYRARTLSRRS